MKKNSQTITVKSNEKNPEPIEIIAASIIKISDGMDKINSLHDTTTLLIPCDSSGNPIVEGNTITGYRK